MPKATTAFEIGQEIGLRETSPGARGWLAYVVQRRMKRALAKAQAKRAAGAYAGAFPEERARTVVRWACAKAAITGALSGAVSTGAVVATAETKGLAGIVALPFAAAVIGLEMATRAVVHIDLACELAELFEVPLDSADVVRLLSLRSVSHDDEVEDALDLGQSQVARATVDSDALFERAAYSLLGESVLRNLLPFVGVFSSAVTNVVVTRRLGRTLRRSFRYERALVDALHEAEQTCSGCMELLVEGLWFLFIADGRLSFEELACLSQRLDDLDDESRARVHARFCADETDWLARLPSVPEAARAPFLHVLEVAAALDKALVLPEEKLLRRVAEALACTHDPQRVRSMIDELERSGVLA
jgi:hypothetical protein